MSTLVLKAKAIRIDQQLELMLTILTLVNFQALPSPSAMKVYETGQYGPATPTSGWGWFTAHAAYRPARRAMEPEPDDRQILGEYYQSCTTYTDKGTHGCSRLYLPLRKYVSASLTKTIGMPDVRALSVCSATCG